MISSNLHTDQTVLKNRRRTALVRFGVRQHARAESISTRARSTTPTSRHFSINGLRAVRDQMIAKGASTS